MSQYSRSYITLTYFLAYCFLSEGQGQSPYLFTLFFYVMVFSKEDCILIEQLHRFKGYGAKKLVKELPEKKWEVRSVWRLLKKLKETGTASRQPGSGRRRILTL